MKSFFEKYKRSIVTAIILSFTGGVFLFFSINKFETYIQMIILITGLIIHSKIASQDKYSEFLSGLLITIIFTIITGKLYKLFNPISEEEIIKIGSTIMFYLRYNYLLLVGMTISLIRLILKIKK